MRLLSLLLVCVSALFSGSALAAKKPRVALEAPAPIAKLIKAAIAKKFTPVISDNGLSATSSAAELREAIDDSTASALVLATKNGNEYDLNVYDVNGQSLDTVTFASPGKKPPKSLGKAAPKQLLLALSKARAVKKKPAEAVAAKDTNADAQATAEANDTKPAETAAADIAKAEPIKVLADEPAPEPAAPVVRKVADETPAAAEPPASAVTSNSEAPTRESFRASVGYRGFNRSLSFVGDTSNQLAQYSTPFAGGVSVDARWFPAASMGDSFAGNIGLFGQGDFSLGLTSQLDTSNFATRSDRIRAGLVVRIPISSFSLLPHAGISSHSFSIAPTAANSSVTRPNIPDVAFFGVRGGIGANIALGSRVAVDLNTGFTYNLRKGEVESARFFPGANAIAFDAAAGLSFQLMEHFDLRLGVDFTRYILTFPASPTALFTATGAGDQYLGASLSAVWRM